MNSRLLLVLLAMACTGCVSDQSAARRAPYVKPGLIMLTPDQAERRGVAIRATETESRPYPAGDAAAAIHLPEVKAYTVNRLVDVADPSLMHEQHVVYRREATPSWRLHAPTSQQIMIGPRVPDGRQELQPLLSKELASFLADQRRSAEESHKAIAALFRAMDELSRQQQALAQRQIREAAESPSPADSVPEHRSERGVEDDPSADPVH